MAVPERPDAGGPAPVDFTHLDQQTQGDRGLQKEVLDLFFGQIDSLIAALQNAPDDRTWYENAHAIKGSARGVGLMVLGDLAEAAEAMMGADSQTQRAAHLEEMRAAIAAAYEAVEKNFAC